MKKLIIAGSICVLAIGGLVFFNVFQKQLIPVKSHTIIREIDLDAPPIRRPIFSLRPNETPNPFDSPKPEETIDVPKPDEDVAYAPQTTKEKFELYELFCSSIQKTALSLAAVVSLIVACVEGYKKIKGLKLKPAVQRHKK